jgi:uncharacterized protein (DUF1697 family)
MLRGINVGGHHRVSMPDLCRVFEAMGFGAVSSYVQSGNVIFDAPGRASESRLQATIASALSRELMLDVPIIVRTASTMADVLTHNPFSSEAPPTALHVTFLASEPAAAAVADLEAGARRFEPERLEVRARHVYLLCPNGYGRTKLNPAFLERHLHTPSTTRNWKSVTAIHALLQR